MISRVKQFGAGLDLPDASQRPPVRQQPVVEHVGIFPRQGLSRPDLPLDGRCGGCRAAGREYVRAVEMPGLGKLTPSQEFGWYVSVPVAASGLGGAVGRVIVPDGYAVDPDKDEIHRAVAALLTGDDSGIRAASIDLYRYYVDSVRLARESGLDAELPEIASVEDVWDHVSLGSEFHVDRDPADGHVYVSIEGECDWEPEHGLQLVLKDGRTVTKVGPFDGHLTNASAHARSDLEGVVYVSPFPD